MTILERIRGTRRPVQFGRIAKDLMNRDISALGRDASDVLDQVKDIRSAAADAIEHFQSLASDAVERAGDAVEQVGDGASKATHDLSKNLAKAKDLPGDGLRLDAGVDDLVGRLKQALPTERITHLVENLERELPTTDKGRYDRAYERGWARARTSFVVIGAATGIAAGIAGAYLFDPKLGTQRRERLQARLRGVTKTVSRQATRSTKLATDRARGFAIERGIVKPDGGDHAARSTDAGTGTSSTPVMQATPVAPLVGVMDQPTPAVEPVMPFADGPVTDPASIEREPFGAPDGGVIGGTGAASGSLGEEPATDVTPGTGTTDPLGDPVGGSNDDARLPVNSSAVTSTLEPQAEDATITGDGEDRGTWHRTL